MNRGEPLSGIMLPEVITALPTAFDSAGDLNLEGTRQILQKAAKADVDGGFVLGTTGEFPALSFGERGEVIRLAVEELHGRRSVVHVGAASLYEVRHLIEQARSLGASEIAVITPYYLPATDGALYDFYQSVSQLSEGLAVYVYAFRERTGNKISGDLMGKLAQLPNIVGAKISGETLDGIDQYKAKVPEDFLIYTGNDRDIAKTMDYGLRGVVSGIAAALPEPFAEMRQLVSQEGGSSAINQAQLAVDNAVDVIEGDIANIKAALRGQGIDAGYPRMAVAEPGTDRLRAIQEELRRAPR